LANSSPDDLYRITEMVKKAKLQPKVLYAFLGTELSADH